MLQKSLSIHGIRLTDPEWIIDVIALFEFCDDRKIESGASKLKLNLLCGHPLADRKDKIVLRGGWERPGKGARKTREEQSCREYRNGIEYSSVSKEIKAGLKERRTVRPFSLSQFTSHILNRAMVVTDFPRTRNFFSNLCVPFLSNLNSYFVLFRNFWNADDTLEKFYES